MTRKEAEGRMRTAELESVGSLSTRTRLRSQAAELGHLRSERDSLRAEVERLRKAIQTVLDDDETGAGGWGPDITMAAVLKAAMDGEP
jgi:Flp pilus assembly CpaE family ATPase